MSALSGRWRTTRLAGALIPTPARSTSATCPSRPTPRTTVSAVLASGPSPAIVTGDGCATGPRRSRRPSSSSRCAQRETERGSFGLVTIIDHRSSRISDPLADLVVARRLTRRASTLSTRRRQPSPSGALARAVRAWLASRAAVARGEEARSERGAIETAMVR